MSKKFTKYATFSNPETGESKTYAPGEELPDWADASKLNPAIFEDEDTGLDEDGNPTRVAGPGMATPPEETEDEAAERKAAEAKRKRDQRAAKKKADEEAQRLADEREQAEKDAAAKAEADRLAAEQGGQQS